MKTSDICDQAADAKVCVAPWRSFGGCAAFSGRIATIRTYEDAGLIRQKLETTGYGQVLVVDGGGSLQRAIFGDRMAALGMSNGWAGVLVYGAVRDTESLAKLEFGVCALGSVPARGCLNGRGDCDVTLTLGGAHVAPGEYIVVDTDGVVITQSG